MRSAFGFSALVASALLSGMAHASPRSDLFGEAEIASADTTVPMVVRIARDVRLRADLVTSSRQADPFGNPEGPMRHRFASSMIDFYPLGGNTGLRVSGGLRFYEVQNFYGDAVRSTDGLLWEPRVTGRNTGMRTGFARHTPAATVGYSGKSKNVMFGIEVGSLLGNANATVPTSFGRGQFSRGGGLNPIANFNVGLRF